MKKNHFTDKANKYIMSVDVMKSITDFSIIIENELTIAKVNEEDKKRIMNVIENEKRRGITKLNYDPDEILYLINIFAAGEISNNFEYIKVDYRKLAKLYYSYELEKDTSGKHHLKKTNIDEKMQGHIYKRFDKLIVSLTKDIVRVMYDAEKENYEVCFEPAILSFEIDIEGVKHKKGVENILKDKTRRIYKILLHPKFAEQIFKTYMLRSYNSTELVAALNQVPAPVQRLILTLSGSPNNTILTYKKAYAVAYNEKDETKIYKSNVARFKKFLLEYKDILQDWGIEAREDGITYKIASE